MLEKMGRFGSPMSEMSDKSRRRLRRRLTGAALLVVGLSVAGGLAATLTPAPQVAVADQSQSALLRTGQQLYETACITCHGANLQGVQGRGPSLIGVGEASVFFQVSTGRMPAMRGEAQAPARRRPSTARRSTRSVPTCRPTAAVPWSPRPQRRGRQQVADRHRPGPRRRPVPPQLRVVPQLHRQGRCPVLRQVRAWSDGRQPHRDLHRDADRPAEHAQVLRPTAVAGGEEGHRRLRPDGGPHPESGWLRAGWLRPAPEGMAIWIIGMVAVIGVALWIGARA